MDYYNYPKVYIGGSDRAKLIWTSWNGVGFIDFVEDGEYDAYVVDESANIGLHYYLVASGTKWLTVYDDNGLTYKVDHITAWRIYRAGDKGCVIQLIY